MTFTTLSRRINPNGAVGHTVPAVFSDGYFTMEKGVLRSEISWLFLIHYELSEIQKNVFTVFWGDLEGGLIHPPHTQATLGLISVDLSLNLIWFSVWQWF